MLRALALLLSLLAAVPPSLGVPWQDAGGHEGEACCCCEAEAASGDQPSLAPEPCGCGCISPQRTPEAPQPDHRDRWTDREFSEPIQAGETLVPVRVTEPAPPRLRVSPVPLRAPPPQPVLCVWQE